MTLDHFDASIPQHNGGVLLHDVLLSVSERDDDGTRGIRTVNLEELSSGGFDLFWLLQDLQAKVQISRGRFDDGDLVESGLSKRLLGVQGLHQFFLKGLCNILGDHVLRAGRQLDKTVSLLSGDDVEVGVQDSLASCGAVVLDEVDAIALEGLLHRPGHLVNLAHEFSGCCRGHGQEAGELFLLGDDQGVSLTHGEGIQDRDHRAGLIDLEAWDLLVQDLCEDVVKVVGGARGGRGGLGLCHAAYLKRAKEL
mmetsp:Transcript_60461/g.128156  ORF Transcript_60461/g.128156 Transcript_60461/m.128156 type:complete len:252 (+) Transcript_60461:544-1299(+)